MNEQAKDVWSYFNASYEIDAGASPSDLLDDSAVWLDSAQGMAQTLGEVVNHADGINHDRLSSALFGIALLIDMGRRCTHQAHLRMLIDKERQQHGQPTTP
jgi:hypothetical protein